MNSEMAYWQIDAHLFFWLGPFGFTTCCISQIPLFSKVESFIVTFSSYKAIAKIKWFSEIFQQLPIFFHYFYFSFIKKRFILIDIVLLWETRQDYPP